MSNRKSAVSVRSKDVVLPHENSEHFEQLRHSYLERFQPADQPERDLVETMASARWRLKRLAVIETRLMDNGLCLRHKELAGKFGKIDRALSLLLRCEAQINRTYERALQQLQFLQNSRPPAPDPAQAPCASARLPDESKLTPILTLVAPPNRPPTAPKTVPMGVFGRETETVTL